MSEEDITKFRQIAIKFTETFKVLSINSVDCGVLLDWCPASILVLLVSDNFPDHV